VAQTVIFRRGVAGKAPTPLTSVRSGAEEAYDEPLSSRPLDAVGTICKMLLS